MMNAIAIPKTVYDLCQAREDAVALFQTAYKTIKNIEQSLEGCGSFLCPYNMLPKTDIINFKKILDKNLWRHAFNQIGLLQYMDAQAKNEFEQDLGKDAPEFTLENIKTTFFSAAADADKMFARGIVNTFHWLSPDHKTNTNSPFKINPKAVMKYMVLATYSGGLQISYYGEKKERINDIDRVVKTLDRKKHQPGELETVINAAFCHGTVYEDDYYRIKGFKNGNMHFEFKRQDLLDKINLIIAKYYGENHLVA